MGGSGDEKGSNPNQEAEENFSESSVESRSDQIEDEVSDKSLKKARYVWQIKGNYHLKCSGDEKDSSIHTSECASTELKDEVQIQTTSCCSSNSMEESDDSDEHDVPPPQSDAEIIAPVSYKRASPVWYRPRPDWPVLKWQTRQVAKAFVDNTINCVLEDMGFVPLPADSVDILDEEFSSPQREQNDSSLEDRAVLMAIQSHGLQRSDKDQSSSFQHGSSNFKKNERRMYLSSSFSDLHCENSDLKQSYAACHMSTNKYNLQKNLNIEGSDFLSELSECSTVTSETRMHSDYESHSSGKINSLCMHGPDFHDCPNYFSNHACICPVRHSGISEKVGSSSEEYAHGSFSAQTDLLEGQGSSLNAVKCKLIENIDDDASQPHPSHDPDQRQSSHPVFKKRPAEETEFSSDLKKRCLDRSAESPESLPSVHLTSSHSQASLVPDSSIESEGRLQSFEHFDFMDAAVAAAIQRKGLSALACTEYG